MKRLSFFILVVFHYSVWAADIIFSKGDIAVNGYDVVAYHTEAKAIKGDKKYTHHWNNVDWLFSSKKNRDAFKKLPSRYTPQYGGFCAFAVSKGSLAPTDPHAWTIYKGKLYLNYSKAVRTTWKKDIDAHIQRADKNWPRLNKAR
ncbi:MAG: YHS domain protein [Proteobacteria bacterium]|nr:YHS domain protein [Pseudomonadota bacterium]